MSDSKFGTPWTGENRGPLNYLDGLIAPFVILSASGDVVGFFFDVEYAARARDSVNACEGIHPTVLTSWNMQGEKKSSGCWMTLSKLLLNFKNSATNCWMHCVRFLGLLVLAAPALAL